MVILSTANFKRIVISSHIPNKKLKVALTYNVKPEENNFSETKSLSLQSNSPNSINDTYAEWDTIETVTAIRNALAQFHDVTMIEANEEAFEKFRAAEPEIVFNVAEGASGINREAQIPAMLEMLKIPYTGSDPLTLATCLDKSRTKEILSYHCIPTSKFLLVESIGDLRNFSLRFPVIIKPVAEGSSKGIFNSSFISRADELAERISANLNSYDQPILVEEFLPGREFTVALIGNGDETEVLPVIEINFGELPNDLVPIYSYEAKWIADTREKPLNIFTCPAKIDDGLRNKIAQAALKAFKALRCRDWSRIDIRLDRNGEPNIIEINPLPGILPDPLDNSCFPKAARAAGLNYGEMLNKVLLIAAKRYNLI